MKKMLASGPALSGAAARLRRAAAPMRQWAYDCNGDRVCTTFH
jgi:hypothetical protein